MHRKLLARLAPFSIIVGLVGLAACASSDGTDSTPSSDDITPRETAAAAASTNATADDETHAEDGAPIAVPEDTITILSPPEDSASFIDAEDGTLPSVTIPPGEIDPDSLNQTSSCQRATGYRNGHKLNLCVTTVDGKYVEVNTARAYLRMRSAARKVGVHLYVNSGFRTMASQRYLYGCYTSKRCNGGNLAAVPGYSNHQSGHALDLDTSASGVYSWLANHGHSYGFRRTVPSEKWHWEH
jgi:hypothetical protein